MAGTAFPPGWHHVAAVRCGGSIKLFVDGSLASTQSGFDAADYDLSVDHRLRIGFGPNDYFKGRLSDVKLYRRALTDAEIQVQVKDR